MNSNFIIPKSSQLINNQAKLILKGPGLGLIKQKFFAIDSKKASDESVGFSDFDKKSLFGTPIFDVLRFDAFSYEDAETGKTINAARFDFEVALMTVNKPRNIVRTAITGRNGTVKEYMSDGDYEINVRGSFVNELPNARPESLIRAFDAITKAPIQLKVESNFLNFFEIYSIVITDSSVSQREGSLNIVDYEFNCISDTPFEIQSENESRRSQPTASF
jgi:hypothetical protein